MADYAPSVYQIDGEFSFSLNKKYNSKDIRDGNKYKSTYKF